MHNKIPSYIQSKLFLFNTDLKLIIIATLTLTLCLGVGPGIGSTLNVGWDFVVTEPKQRLL